MRKIRIVWLMITLSVLISGCLLRRGKPTPIPWIPTATPGTPAGTTKPSATAAAQAVVTPTASSLNATPTPAAHARTATPTEPASGQAEGQAITLELPVEDQSVGNPVHIEGRTRQMPFEGTLVIRVYDALDQLAAEVPIVAQGDYGQSATFEANIMYGGVPGAGRVEVLEFSARDGSVIAEAAVAVMLSGFPGGGIIEQPAPLSDVTLPIKLLARVGNPGDQVNVTVAWNNDANATFAHLFTTLEGLDGRGLLVVPLDIVAPHFDHPDTQMGRVEIHTLEGSPLAYQPIRILHTDDPATMGVQVYWIRGEALAPQTLRIPRTQGVARAALDALLWGPVPHNQEGFSTQIPTPAQILAYPGRDASWGECIQIRALTIDDGVAYADFSIELSAYSGGALQSVLMREQIEATLQQFSTVDEVVITVSGVPAVLEP